jgi:phage/plasmid-associated DNA primase
MQKWISLLSRTKTTDDAYSFISLRTDGFQWGNKFNIRKDAFFQAYHGVLDHFSASFWTGIVWKPPKRIFSPATLDIDFRLSTEDRIPDACVISLAEELSYEFQTLTGVGQIFVMLARKRNTYLRSDGKYADGFHMYILGVEVSREILVEFRKRCLSVLEDLKQQHPTITNSAEDILDKRLCPQRSNGLILLGDQKGPGKGGSHHVIFYAGYQFGWVSERFIRVEETPKFIRSNMELIYGWLFNEKEGWPKIGTIENEEVPQESGSTSGEIIQHIDVLVKYLPKTLAESEYTEWKTYLINCKNAGITWESFKEWCQHSSKYDSKVKTQWDNFERQPTFLTNSVGFLLKTISDHFANNKLYTEWEFFLLEFRKAFFDEELFYCDGEFDFAALVKDYWVDNVISIGESEKTNFVFCAHRGNLWMEMSKSGGVSSTILNHLKDYFEDRRWKMKMVYNAVGKYFKKVKKCFRHDRMKHIIGQQRALGSLLSKLGSPRFYKQLPQILTKWSSIRSDEYNIHFDQDLDSLACKNGLIDLRTGKIRDILKHDRITVACPTMYDEGADITFIDKLMSDVFRDLKQFVHVWLGYMISGRNNLNKFLLHVGAGNNMKSVLDRILRETLGPELYQNIPMKAMRVDAGNNPYLYTAKTARCLSINETEKSEAFNAGALKSMTGADAITAMAKFTNQITYHPKFKLNIFTNHEPELPDDDQAVNRRTWKLFYDKVFLDMNDPIDKLQWSADKFAKGLIGKKDRMLSDKLTGKRTEFLRWLVLGAMKFYKNGMLIQAPDKINQYTLDYIRRAQTLQIFMRENYVEAKSTVDNRIPLRWIYDKYIEHTGRLRTSYNRIKFRKDLEHLGFKTKNARYNWEGCEKGAQLCVLAIRRNVVGEVQAPILSESIRTSPWDG